MYEISKPIETGKAGSIQSDTTAASPDPRPNDPWLFTDPAALELYQRWDRLGQLKEDISNFVMVHGEWSPEDVESKCEIRRLLREGRLAYKSSFGYLSPHPTVYYAAGGGNLKIAGYRYGFKSGDELVFVPWLARLARPAHCGPIWIGAVQPSSNPCLCCEAFPQICIHCDKTIALLRQILDYSKPH